MTKSRRNVLLSLALVAVVALDLWVQQPKTTGEWVKAIGFLVIVVVWTDSRARQRAKDERSEVADR